MIVIPEIARISSIAIKSIHLLEYLLPVGVLPNQSLIFAVLFQVSWREVNVKRRHR
jgi:hypothetical protein